MQQVRRRATAIAIVARAAATFSLFSFCPLGAENAYGADWPMWRCDVRRSATTEEQLPRTLRLAWVRELPPLEPAWPDEPRMTFDLAYAPVLVGELVLVSSPREDCLMAFDAETGEEKWRFYAQGPIRFAPAVWRGKAYVVSDDGYLYCLQVEDGKVLWKFCGAPTEQKVLGNKRLISMWPARGGPVVDEGRVYFAAGIWPFMGVFIYALDARTGKVLWVNETAGMMYIDQPHNSPAFAGVAPQGYFAIIGDNLLVPSSRSVAACFNKNTGELMYFRLAHAKHRGGADVCAMEKFFLNNGSIFRLRDGESLGDIGSSVVVESNVVYAVERGYLKALDMTQFKIDVEGDAKERGEKQIVPKQLWRIKGVERVYLRAGNKLYVSAGKRIGAVELREQGREARLSWLAEVEGQPWSAIAGNGKLIIATKEGKICCFSGDAREARVYRYSAQEDQSDPRSGAAEELLRSSRVREGYCLVFGVDDPSLLVGLASGSQLHVVGIDEEERKVVAAREVLARTGLYGARVAVLQARASAEVLPPYLASLVVLGDAVRSGKAPEDRVLQAAFHCLRPYGGVAVVGRGEQAHRALAEARERLRWEGCRVEQRGDFAVVVREGPLAGAGTWTQQYGNPANTCVSSDELVRLPLGVLWFGGSSNADILPRHGHGPPEQVIAGRLFIEGPDSLRAMDVYTGRVLWRTELPGVGEAYDNTAHQPGANALGTNFVATEDRVYVAYGDRCVVLDAATGRKMGELFLPRRAGEKQAPRWGYIGVWRELLIAGAEPVVFDGIVRFGVKDNWDGTASKRIVVMDRVSGKVLWEKEATHCFRHNAIAVGGGKLFCIDRLPDAIIKKQKRRGIVSKEEPVLYAFDVRTGKELWKTKENVFGTWLGYSDEYDVLLQAGRPSRDMLDDEPDDRMIAYRGAEGKVLWDKRRDYKGPCMLHGRTIITQDYAVDLLTGERKMRENPLTGELMEWEYERNYGCNTAIASKWLITFRSAAAGYYDLERDGGTGNFGGFRSGCTSNLIAADGVLNAPDYTRTCTCSYQIQTSLALVHMPEVEVWTFNDFDLSKGRIKRLGVNLGAPGDRVSDEGTLWLEYPIVGGPSPEIDVRVAPKEVRWFRRHSLRMREGEKKWVAASGGEGLRELRIGLARGTVEPRPYTVRLHFAEPWAAKPGERVFDVRLQGKTVLRGLDIAREAGGELRELVKEFRGVLGGAELRVELVPRGAGSKPPLLCGVEIVAEGW